MHFAQLGLSLNGIPTQKHTFCVAAFPSCGTQSGVLSVGSFEQCARRTWLRTPDVEEIKAWVWVQEARVRVRLPGFRRDIPNVPHFFGGKRTTLQASAPLRLPVAQWIPLLCLLACLLAGWLAGWLACWLACLLAGWLACLLAGWLAGWLAWLADWPAGWLACLLAG